MMESFAQRYCQCNPGVFQSTGSAAGVALLSILLSLSFAASEQKTQKGYNDYLSHTCFSVLMSSRFKRSGMSSAGPEICYGTLSSFWEVMQTDRQTSNMDANGCE